jgi:hypothetical protein
VTGILADWNVGGHALALVRRAQADPWREFADELGLKLFLFRDVGLESTARDVEVWELCQREGFVLVTANRNDDGPDSLEAVIRSRGTPASLPVFTIGNSDRIFQSADYADRVVERMLEFLLDLNAVRGTGRLYLP